MLSVTTDELQLGKVRAEFLRKKNLIDVKTIPFYFFVKQLM